MVEPRLLVEVMFIGAGMRSETVSLVRFTHGAGEPHLGVEIERAVRPTRALGIAWFERARLDSRENTRYAVRILKDGESVATYALPSMAKMPAITPDEEAHERAERDTQARRDRLRALTALAYDLGQAHARGKP